MSKPPVARYVAPEFDFGDTSSPEEDAVASAPAKHPSARAADEDINVADIFDDPSTPTRVPVVRPLYTLRVL